jgi:hypothetical protein
MSHDGGAPPNPYGPRPDDPGTHPHQPLPPHQAPPPHQGPTQHPQPPPYGHPAPYPYPHPPSGGTDGFSVAALVTGILGMAVVPVVLGIIGLVRVGRTGESGKGMAIAGIVLGAIWIVLWLVIILVGVAFLSEVDWNEFDPSVYERPRV